MNVFRIPRHAGRVCGRRGFTLTELLVVLAIIVIMAAVIFPALSAARNRGYDADCASNLRQIGTALYQYATGVGANYFPGNDTGRDPDSFAGSQKNLVRSLSEFVPAHSPLAKPVALPDAVAFRDVILPAVGTVTEGTVFAQFSPDGWADPLVVHLRSRAGADVTLAIEPLTGRTRVADGYITLDRDRGHDPARRDDALQDGGGMRRNHNAAR